MQKQTKHWGQKFVPGGHYSSQYLCSYLSELELAEALHGTHDIIFKTSLKICLLRRNIMSPLYLAACILVNGTKQFRNSLNNFQPFEKGDHQSQGHFCQSGYVRIRVSYLHQGQGQMRKKRDLELQVPMRQERSYFPVDSRNVGACNAVKRKEHRIWSQEA